ncbi:sulfatase-like hydrolase/transferase [Neisseriaceae bacterium B1]
MNIINLLTKDYRLNYFNNYRKEWLFALCFVLLPNILFWFIAYFMNLARPIINLDYLFAAAIFVLPLPLYLGRMIGGLIWILAFIIDCLMFVVQFFPFMDIAAMRYLVPFILEAPREYQVIAVLLFIYCIVFLIVWMKCADKTSYSCVLLLCTILGFLGWQVRMVSYRDMTPEYFGRTNYFVAQSQWLLYDYENNTEYAQLRETKPLLIEWAKESAIPHLKFPYSQKILFIVAESWGVAREDVVQKEVLRNIYAQQDNFEFIESGYFDFEGSTVQAEMRELCHKRTRNGYAFSKLDAKEFTNCIPNKLKKEGYATIAIHGASSRLYDRNNWYLRAGFDKVLASESFINLKRCYAFNGVCDSALTGIIANEFAEAGRLEKNKFVYWLSLTSHHPYSQKDMHSKGIDCKQFNLFEGDICNQFRLHTQFFDDLGELIKRPEMKGVEVIVVGDHMPPIIGTNPIQKNLRWNDVSWIHFKIKA